MGVFLRFSSLARFEPPSLPSRSQRLQRASSIFDLERLARRALPRPVFDLVQGGADDEVTVARNRQAFDDVSLIQRVLPGTLSASLKTSVVGCPIEIPFILAPTGATRLIHHEGELAVARSAERAGTIYALSTMGTTSIEDVAKVSSGPLWFNIYVSKDRGLLVEFLDRSREAGYRALCLTVDVPVIGNRERDRRSGLTVPPVLSIRTLFEGALRPRWSSNFLWSDAPRFANVPTRGSRVDGEGLYELSNELFDETTSWDDIAWIVEHWKGPVLLKGIQHPDDAQRAISIGIKGLIVSNHGGRQLDQAASSLALLPAIVDCIGGAADVVLDGGIRRGTDVVKALSLGARCCMIGRPYLYGLAAGGEQGVDRMFEILRSEIDRALILLGCPNVTDLSQANIFR